MKRTLLISVLVTVFAPGSLLHAGCGPGESSTTVVAPAAAPVSAPVVTMVNVVTTEAASLSASFSGDDLQACIDGRDELCLMVFKSVIRQLDKILTYDYRMKHSLHMFNPNRVEYSREIAQRLSRQLLAAKR